MLNFFHFTIKILNVKLIKINPELLINYQETKLGSAERNKEMITADILLYG